MGVTNCQEAPILIYPCRFNYRSEICDLFITYASYIMLLICDYL